MRKFKLFLLILTIVFSTNIFAELTKEQQEEVNKEMQYFNVYDPFESINKRIYYFNYQFDKYIFLPTVNFYKTITPVFVQKGVTNFFDNTGNINVATNALLQGKVRTSMKSIGRFTMNIAFGLGGLIDFADKCDMPEPYEDFGLTLAHYGIGNGPYIVLPILGPSSLRDGVGSLVGFTAERNFYNVSHLSDMNKIGVTITKGIDKRANNDFRYYETGSPFEYEYVRFLYFKYRYLQQKLETKVM